MADDGEEDMGEQELEAMQLGGMVGQKKKGNILPVWGNEKTMNLNNMILTNIQGSPYYKVQLAEIKTYHEVVDQIYNHVNHLEPWERGSRKTSGQIGMCGGVRGVGAGGIVSSAFCLLFKLFTIKITRKQLNGLLNHEDSPYLRGVGFLYIRFCQPPPELWELFEPYLDDQEEVDPKAGGGDVQRVGQMVRHLLTRLDWYGTLFPRIPVPVQKQIDVKLKEYRTKQQTDRFQQHVKQLEPPKRDSPQVTAEKETRRRSRSPLQRSRQPSPPDRGGRKGEADDRHSRRDERNERKNERDERRRSPDRRERRRESPPPRRRDSPPPPRGRGSPPPPRGRGSPPRRDFGRKNGESSSHRERPERSERLGGARGDSGGGRSPVGDKEKDDFAELLEREKERQRHSTKNGESGGRTADSRTEKPKRDRRSRSRSTSSSGSGQCSDSSGTVKRKGKEESEKKNRHKKHKSSRHREERDRSSRRGSKEPRSDPRSELRTDQRSDPRADMRSERDEPRKRSKSPVLKLSSKRE